MFLNIQPTKKISTFLRNPLLKDRTYLLYRTKKGFQKFKDQRELRTLIRKKKFSSTKELHLILVQIRNKTVRSQFTLEKKTNKISTLKQDPSSI